MINSILSMNFISFMDNEMNLMKIYYDYDKVIKILESSQNMEHIKQSYKVYELFEYKWRFYLSKNFCLITRMFFNTFKKDFNEQINVIETNLKNQKR